MYYTRKILLGTVEQNYNTQTWGSVESCTVEHTSQQRYHISTSLNSESVDKSLQSASKFGKFPHFLAITRYKL